MSPTLLGENSGSCRNYHIAGQREGSVTLSASAWLWIGHRSNRMPIQRSLSWVHLLFSRVYTRFLGYSHIIFCGCLWSPGPGLASASGWNEDMKIVSWYISQVSFPTFIPLLCLSSLPSAFKILIRLCDTLGFCVPSLVLNHFISASGSSDLNLLNFFFWHRTTIIP